jgi:hypothetical protein
MRSVHPAVTLSTKSKARTLLDSKEACDDVTRRASTGSVLVIVSESTCNA